MIGGRTAAVVRRLVLAGATICLCPPVFAQPAPSDPAAMISAFRKQHGEKPVVLDSTLTRIAHDQAAAMAAKDRLDHDVLGNFNRRVAPAGAGRAAENIAFGYESFPKTLTQWIESSGHRRNLLLHNASRVGVASVKSGATGRTYWAMVIAGDYEARRPPGSAPMRAVKEPKVAAAPKPKQETKPKPRAEACRVKLLGVCF